ncbi:MAG: NAD(P)-dependent oxidoreductase, partial [Alphaproteobacteria bacterium]
FRWLSAPKALMGQTHVEGVKAVAMRLGLPDASGRQVPEEIQGSEFVLEADLVIKALGFDPEDLPTLFDAPELAVSRWGTIRTDFTTQMTNLDGVFAAGDIVRGASLVVWSIKDGRDAATAIHNYLLAEAEGSTSEAAE